MNVSEKQNELAIAIVTEEKGWKSTQEESRFYEFCWELLVLYSC
jgi:hypothetical protein